MEFIDYNSAYEITEVKLDIQDSEIIIKWHWPETMNAVFICKAKTEEGFKEEDFLDKRLALCTKHEYQNRGFYSEKVSDRDEFIYRIYPAVKSEGKWRLVNQENKNNEGIICTGKVNIRAKIAEKRVPFSNLKRIEISITSDIRISREGLNYVIKAGGFPHSLEDGLMYEFSRDIDNHKLPMPEIVVPQNYFLKIFFTNEIALRRYNIINE